MNRISRFASILLTALQLPLFSSVVTYGRTKKLIGNAGRLVSPKNDKDNVKNRKVGKTKDKGKHKVDSVKRSRARDEVKSVVDGVVDDFFDRPIESSLKYLGIPFLCYEAFSIIKNEIYNCRHFPSRMKPELIIYLVETGFKRWPSKDELKEYCEKNFFVVGVYNGDSDWDTKEKMISYLAGILMTNYYLGDFWSKVRQVGYTIIDVLLFRDARERVNVSAKRFLNNEAGDCFSLACYLLLFAEALGFEARIGFFAFESKHLPYSHACLVYRRKDKPSWVIFDPIYSMMKKTECKMEKPINDLLVLGEIKKDKSHKIAEMKCAKIEKINVKCF